jgi:hypothetical protein
MKDKKSKFDSIYVKIKDSYMCINVEKDELIK